MNSELINVLVQIEEEKGISKEFMLGAVESALVSAYKKEFKVPDGDNVKVKIDPDTGSFKVKLTRIVVEDNEVSGDENHDISLSEAKEIDPNFMPGDFVETDVTPNGFGRAAAQAAKQIVVQKMREAEKNLILDEYKNRETELVSGVIYRCSMDTVFVTLGSTEAVMLSNGIVPGETYVPGQIIKAVISEISSENKKNSRDGKPNKGGKGVQVIISRSHPELVKRLFETEVPEISEGYVHIKSVAREPGARTKIAVYASDTDIDPVGACVGARGIRVQNVVNELGGEKIDIIKWSEVPGEYIANSLSPSTVEFVIVNESEKYALVVVPDYQLSLAIGKAGQNAKLAAKLTGWKIDIKSITQYQEEFEVYDDESAECAEHYDDMLEDSEKKEELREFEEVGELNEDSDFDRGEANES